MYLETLPVELIFQIFALVSVEDIISLRCTCQALSAVTRDRSVWYNALLYHVVEQGLPVPGTNRACVSELSAANLEQVTMRALHSRRNWTSPTPNSTTISEIATLRNYEDGESSRTFASYFVPGRGGRFLISLTRTERAAGGQRYTTLQCWDLHAAPPACIASQVFYEMLGLQVNSEEECDIVLTVTSRMPFKTSAYTLDLSAASPQSGFILVQAFESLPTPLKLAGSQFFATDDSNRVRVYDVTSGQLNYVLRVPLLLNDETIFLEEHRCLAIYVIQGFIITFCQQWTHVYALPTADPQHNTDEPTELEPVHAHHWAYRIDTLKVAARDPHPLRAQFRPMLAPALPVLDLLVRFDSWFPWPVNILHHLILSPNPSFTGAEHELPYFADGAAPHVAAALPSPLRLFTPSDAVLGAHGTALWLDAQTGGGGPSQAGDRGQRIAGRVLRRAMPAPAPSEQAAARDPRHAVDLHAPADAAAEGETMVFLCSENSEEWGRLALCEEEGRIAVSCVDARVLVYDYT
ncbi:hypothetical protein PHLGIDRAFT_499330 [Phlebiopsis gigantea 11061_1 CR5-6]|uniref:F-box domain-containing protein n=1 Tax=Phlebiopsis gigantea (strain 11061_1 CR5-6) TaxID=745531 RepID=A0A0C3NEI7_PHLG1|nr:hypothetical protein PHLGIDRAFT_499330 [Phlebiopsis gigantea 11061_1 CR5-6]